MDINWRHPLMTRVLIFMVSVFCFAWVLAKDSSWIVVVFIALAVAFQVIRFGQLSGEEPLPGGGVDLSSVAFDEQSQSFKTSSLDPSLNAFTTRLNDTYNATKQQRRDRDSDYQFFRNIVQHVGIGLLTFK